MKNISGKGSSIAKSSAALMASSQFDPWVDLTAQNVNSSVSQNKNQQTKTKILNK